MKFQNNSIIEMRQAVNKDIVKDPFKLFYKSSLYSPDSILINASSCRLEDWSLILHQGKATLSQ